MSSSSRQLSAVSSTAVRPADLSLGSPPMPLRESLRAKDDNVTIVSSTRMVETALKQSRRIGMASGVISAVVAVLLLALGTSSALLPLLTALVPIVLSAAITTYFARIHVSQDRASTRTSLELADRLVGRTTAHSRLAAGSSEIGTVAHPARLAHGGE